MSTKAVIIWLVLAVVLGIIVIFLLFFNDGSAKPPSGTVTVGTRLLTITPGEVERVSISTPGQPNQIIEKAPNAKGILGADADWQLHIEPLKPGDPTPAPWPLESARMQSLLRVLGEMQAAAIPAPGSDLGHPTIIQVGLTNNRTIKISLAERTLAGTGLAEIDAPPAKPVRALVEDKIHAVFTAPGPRAWRDPFPFGGIAPDASRIRVVGKGKPVALAKLDGKWSLREPVAAPADSSAVQRWLAIVARVAVSDFLDAGPPALTATGLDKPTGSLTIEADRRILAPGATDPKVSTDILALTIGGAADAGATTVFGAVGTSRVVLLDAHSLLSVSSDAAAFVWPHPLREAAADIGSIAITLKTPLPTSTAQRSFRRSGGRWVQILSDKSEIALAEKDLKDVEALLLMLTGPDKSAAASNGPPPTLPRPTITLEAPPEYRQTGSIILNSIADHPIETLEIGTAGNDMTVVRTGPIFRTYSTSQLPQLLHAAIASSTPDPAAPPEPPSTR